MSAIVLKGLEDAATNSHQPRLIHNHIIGPMSTGPKVSALLDLLLSKPVYNKGIKSFFKEYPRPEKANCLLTPELASDADKTINNELVKEDRRMKSHHMCSTSALSCMEKMLDKILIAKDQTPALDKAGDVLVDCMTTVGFIHSDLKALSLESFKQTII